MMKVLLLGCGKVRRRNISTDGRIDFAEDDLTAIDIDPSSQPDIVMDLNKITEGERFSFDDNSFDEIHAYDILEHLGKFGDWRGFFTEFGEYHRILKKGGLFYILVPVGGDALGDPGHTRIFHQNHFAFLSQEFYEREKNLGTTATDYRWFWKKDFKIEYLSKEEGHHLAVILRKP